MTRLWQEQACSRHIAFEYQDAARSHGFYLSHSLQELHAVRHAQKHGDQDDHLQHGKLASVQRRGFVIEIGVNGVIMLNWLWGKTPGQRKIISP